MLDLDAGDALAPADFRRLFREGWDRMEARFWKVERRQSYDQRGDASFDMWQGGNVTAARETLEEALRSQESMYASARGRGIDLLRLRIVETPLSDYLRTYEIPSYPTSEQMGERVHIAPVPDGDPLPDLLLFDDFLAIVNLYDGLGRPWGAAAIRNPKAIEVAAGSICAALHASVPLSRFNALHPEPSGNH